jgi:hypothetical protein
MAVQRGVILLQCGSLPVLVATVLTSSMRVELCRPAQNLFSLASLAVVQAFEASIAVDGLAIIPNEGLRSFQTATIQTPSRRTIANRSAMIRA